MSAVVQGLSQLRKSALDFIKEVPDDAISCASGGRKTLYKSVDYRLDLNTVTSDIPPRSCLQLQVNKNVKCHKGSSLAKLSQSGATIAVAFAPTGTVPIDVNGVREDLKRTLCDDGMPSGSEASAEATRLYELRYGKGSPPPPPPPKGRK